MSFRSRLSANAFISDEDWDEEEEEDKWCNLCDDEVLATRDVVVLDFVEDVLLLFST